jgi:hypothetical protein
VTTKESIGVETEAVPMSESESQTGDIKKEIAAQKKSQSIESFVDFRFLSVFSESIKFPKESQNQNPSTCVDHYTQAKTSVVVPFRSPSEF